MVANKLNIPSSPPADLNGAPRDVYIVHRVMRGDVVKQVTEAVHEMERSDKDYDETLPHPLHHWGVAVGDTLHHLQSDGFFNTPNWYENKQLPNDEGYKKFQVGSTTFNDLAIQDSGVRTISTMPPLYDPTTNNCQHFTVNVIDLIVRSGRVQVPTTTMENLAKKWDTFIPYDALKSEKVKALGANLAGKAPATAPSTVQAAVVQDQDAQKDLLKNVQVIMDEHTPAVKKEELLQGA